MFFHILDSTSLHRDNFSRKTRYSGLTVALGKYFGNVSGAAITMRHKAVGEQIKKNRRLKGRISRLTKQIINI